MAGVIERREEVAGTPTFWFDAPRPAGGAINVYLHGAPTHADDWLPFLERTGGVAPDLPGFGRSGKSAGFRYSIAGYEAWLDAFLDHIEGERVALVMHDWGGLGLGPAQRAPGRVERIVLIDAVPLLPGYAGHRVAALWRTRGIGELLMGVTSLRTLRRFGGLPAPLPERIMAHFDHGTQRAILQLYRSLEPGDLAAAGGRLADLSCPALVVWGADDPYVPASFAQAYADALGGPARVEVVDGAGHWPWLDSPRVVDLVARFLAEDLRGAG